MTQQTEFRTLQLLRTNLMTRDMKTEHLKRMATAASEVEFVTDEIIYNPGEVGRAVYIVTTGEVVIEMDAAGQGLVNVLTIGPGELFGWSSLFPTERKNARARATRPTKAIALDAEILRNEWQKDHTLEHAIIQRTAQIMVERIKLTRQRLVDALATET